MTYVSKKLRKQTAERANHSCEYCLIPEQVSFFSYQIEHIISLKHKGSSDFENLAFACPICNRHKGSDLGTNVGSPPILTRFFNPRTDLWSEHFELKKTGKIIPVSNIGKATDAIFKFNHQDSILLRKKLITAGILK